MHTTKTSEILCLIKRKNVSRNASVSLVLGLQESCAPEALSIFTSLSPLEPGSGALAPLCLDLGIRARKPLFL